MGVECIVERERTVWIFECACDMKVRASSMLWRKARIWESLRASGVNSIFGPFGSLRPFP
jgi:hypothetical protein